MNNISISDLKESLELGKVPFILYFPMNEQVKYIRSGLLYLTNIATQHYDRLVGFRYRSEEIVLALECAIQAYYLKTSHATYGELFYGLRRSGITYQNLRSGSYSEKQKMLLTTQFTNYHVAISLFFESILPYIKSKVEKWISSNPNSEENSKIKKVLLAIIKAGEILIFTYYFKHLVDSKFVHYKPYLHFFQIAVRFYNDFEQK